MADQGSSESMPGGPLAPPLSEEPLRIKNLDTGEYMTLEELEAYSAAKAEHGEANVPSGSEGAASGKAGAAGSSKAASKLLKGGGKKLSKWANKALHAIQDQVEKVQERVEEVREERRQHKHLKQQQREQQEGVDQTDLQIASTTSADDLSQWEHVQEPDGTAAVVPASSSNPSSFSHRGPLSQAAMGSHASEGSALHASAARDRDKASIWGALGSRSQSQRNSRAGDAEAAVAAADAGWPGSVASGSGRHEAELEHSVSSRKSSGTHGPGSASDALPLGPLAAGIARARAAATGITTVATSGTGSSKSASRPRSGDGTGTGAGPGAGAIMSPAASTQPLLLADQPSSGEVPASEPLVVGHSAAAGAEAAGAAETGGAGVEESAGSATAPQAAQPLAGAAAPATAPVSAPAPTQGGKPPLAPSTAPSPSRLLGPLERALRKGADGRAAAAGTGEAATGKEAASSGPASSSSMGGGAQGSERGDVGALAAQQDEKGQVPGTTGISDSAAAAGAGAAGAGQQAGKSAKRSIWGGFGKGSSAAQPAPAAGAAATAAGGGPLAGGAAAAGAGRGLEEGGVGLGGGAPFLLSQPSGASSDDDQQLLLPKVATSSDVLVQSSGPSGASNLPLGQFVRTLSAKGGAGAALAGLLPPVPLAGTGSGSVTTPAALAAGAAAVAAGVLGGAGAGAAMAGGVGAGPGQARLLGGVRLVQAIEAHEGVMWRMALSRDGSMLATAGQDGLVRVWGVMGSAPQPNAALARGAGAAGAEVAAGAAGGSGSTWAGASTHSRSPFINRAAPLAEEGVPAGAKEGPVGLAGGYVGGGLGSGSSFSTTAAGVLPALSPAPLAVFDGHQGCDVLDLSWSAGGFLLSASVDGTAKLWHLHDLMQQPKGAKEGQAASGPGGEGKSQHHLSLHHHLHHGSHGKEQQAEEQQGAVEHAVCLQTYEHPDFVTSVAFHPHDARRFATGCADGRVRVWGTLEGRVLASASLQQDMVTAVAWSHDGSHVVVGSLHGKLRHYEFVTAPSPRLDYVAQIDVKNRRGMSGASKKVTSLVPVPHSHSGYVVCSDDSRIRLYDRFTMACKFKGLSSKKAVVRAACCLDGRLLVSGSDDGCVYCWALPPALGPAPTPSAAAILNPGAASAAAIGAAAAGLGAGGVGGEDGAEGSGVGPMGEAGLGKAGAGSGSAAVGGGGKNGAYEAFQTLEPSVTAALLLPAPRPLPSAAGAAGKGMGIGAPGLEGQESWGSWQGGLGGAPSSGPSHGAGGAGGVGAAAGGEGTAAPGLLAGRLFVVGGYSGRLLVYECS